MDWFDGLKTRPIEVGGLYVLLCAEPDGSVGAKLGSYTESGWRAGGEKVPAAIYYGCVDNLPADVMGKAAAVAAQLRAAAAKTEAEPAEDPAREADMLQDDDPDLADAAHDGGRHDDRRAETVSALEE